MISEINSDYFYNKYWMGFVMKTHPDLYEEGTEYLNIT
jgi:hypothetical protein